MKTEFRKSLFPVYNTSTEKVKGIAVGTWPGHREVLSFAGDKGPESCNQR